MEIIDQRMVNQTSRISIMARGKFLKPNWMGVKARLKNKLRIKGRRVRNFILPATC
jgi:hypothetical protein